MPAAAKKGRAGTTTSTASKPPCQITRHHSTSCPNTVGTHCLRLAMMHSAVAAAYRKAAALSSRERPTTAYVHTKVRMKVMWDEKMRSPQPLLAWRATLTIITFHHCSMGAGGG